MTAAMAMPGNTAATFLVKCCAHIHVAAAQKSPHFHSEVQHRPFPQRARSPGAEDGSVMANPGPGAPEIGARGG